MRDLPVNHLQSLHKKLREISCNRNSEERAEMERTEGGRCREIEREMVGDRAEMEGRARVRKDTELNEHRNTINKETS